MAEKRERPLRAIGFWRDPGGEDRFRHPIAFVDSAWDTEERELVAAYLRSGTRTASFLGYSWCRFDCGIDDAEMGDSEFSDGEWVWPGGLAHYVLEHAVRLPAEFLGCVRRAAERGGSDPDAHPPEEESFPPCEYDYWMDWCNEHADPASGFRELEEAETKAAIEKDRAEREELRTGWGPCSVAGCERPALKGRELCVWHAAGRDPPDE